MPLRDSAPLGASSRATGPANSALRDVRRVLRGRGKQLAAEDASYRVYMAVMLAIVVAAPLVRLAVIWLAEVLPVAAFPGSAELVGADPQGRSSILAAVLTGVTALAVLAGAQGGPAYAGLAPLDLLFTSAIPRSRLLRRPVFRGLGVGAGIGLLAGALIAVARAVQGEGDVALAAATVLAATGLGLLLSVGMLLGQLGRGIRWALAGALGLLVVAQLLWGSGFDPWSLAARVFLAVPGGFGGSGGALLISAIILLIALLLAVASPRIAAKLRWESLREQAARWDAIYVTAGTGDPKLALDRMGAPVRVGRRWRLRPGHTLTLAIVRRDVLGLLRTPVRSLLAFAGLVAASLLWWEGVAGDPGLVRAGVLCAAAMLLGYLALASLCRGMVAAAEGAGSAPLLPGSPWSLLMRHLIVPFVTALVAGLGIVVLALGAGDAGAAGSIFALNVMWILAALGLRLLAALKGTIPLRLLAPIPTPAGDASGIQVLVWMIDGPILALLVGAVFGMLWAAGLTAGGVPVAAVAVSAVLVAGLLLWARQRLRG